MFFLSNMKERENTLNLKTSEIYSSFLSTTNNCMSILDSYQLKLAKDILKEAKHGLIAILPYTL